MNGKRYLTRAGDGNVIFITTTDDVHVASWVLFLVTIPFLDFVMIHSEFSEIIQGKLKCISMYTALQPSLFDPLDLTN